MFQASGPSVFMLNSVLPDSRSRNGRDRVVANINMRNRLECGFYALTNLIDLRYKGGTTMDWLGPSQLFFD